MQQLTCNIDLSCSFYYLFFSFVLLELKPFVLKGKVLGENSEKVRSVKNSETILPFYRGNTPWVAPACAECPGFLVLGSALAPASTLVSEPQIVPLG